MVKSADAQRTALKASGVRHFTCYALRHTWATRQVEAGTDPVTLAAMLGHSKLQMVTRYAHPSQGHQQEAMEWLERWKIESEIREQAASSAIN